MQWKRVFTGNQGPSRTNILGLSLPGSIGGHDREWPTGFDSGIFPSFPRHKLSYDRRHVTVLVERYWKSTLAQELWGCQDREAKITDEHPPGGLRDAWRTRPSQPEAVDRRRSAPSGIANPNRPKPLDSRQNMPSAPVRGAGSHLLMRA